MDPLETTLGIGIAIVLLGIAGYFIYRQRLTLQSLRADTSMRSEQRVYLTKQSWRRMFGAILLICLGAMMFGSVFLDYDPEGLSKAENPVITESAKQAVRFLSFYLMVMFLILLVILALAVLDFWAIARYGLHQQKQLFDEHQAMLETELLQHKHRQAEGD